MMNQNHNLKESVSKTVKSQSVVKKSTKNFSAEKQKPKQQKNGKNREMVNKVDDRHEEPVDHATKVKLIMEATMRSEEQVCWALQECDNDVDRAVDMLYENSDENSQWVKSGKKKKNKQQQQQQLQQQQQQQQDVTVIGKVAEFENSTTNDEINNQQQQQQQQQMSYFKDPNKEFKLRDNSTRQGSIRGRRGGSNFTNNRSRESGDKFENRNAELGNGSRRGRQFDGNTPSIRGNRGRGASRNTRTFQAKDTRTSYQPIETWDSSDVIKMTKQSEHDKLVNNTDENWDQEFPIEDCYEEYTGSLADTKVFTPSIMTDKMNSLEKIESEMKSKASNAAAANAMVQKFSHALDVQGPTPASQNLIQLASQNPMQMNTLTPAQSQYLNQLAQQTSESLKQQQQQQQQQQQPQQHHQVTNYVPQYSNSYNSYPQSLHDNNSATSAVSQTSTTRNLKNQQKSSRISTTSKIAANSVEMDYLNVQFSGLDLMSNSNLMDASKDKYSTNQVSSSAVSIDDKTGTVSNTQAATALDPYNIPKSTSIVAQMKSDINSEHLSSMSSNYSQNRNSVSTNVPELSKTNDHHNHHQHQQPQQTQTQPQPQQQHQYSAYQKGTNSATMYQNYAPNTNYSNVTNSYSQTNATAAVVAAAAAAAVANNPNYYQNNSFTNMSQFPNYTSSLNQSYYQNNNQLIFGANAGLTSNGAYGGSGNSGNSGGGATGPYNSHTGANSSVAVAAAAVAAAASQNKLNAIAAAAAVKDSQQVYDNSTASSTPSNVTPISTNLTTNTTSTKLSTKGMMTNLAPIVSPPYIMGQTPGIPFYQQPTAMYTIEDLQMLQSRIQHLPTAGYYEMGYQNSTTLTAGRDATAAASAIQNASYTMSDARFARTDSSASPVPSTLSQQNSNQAHQAQPMLNAAALPAAYAYYYNAGMMPGSFQYGTTIYPQMAAAAAANAHGTTNANQYAKATGYPSAYNSGYDTMTQSQDFTKTNYLSGNVTGGGSSAANAAGNSGSQVQNKVMNPVTTAASNTSNDLSMMYAKQPHAAAAAAATLSKINGFPSGTPQGYNLAGTQATGLGPNAAFTTQLFIPTIATHQHPNTTMIHQDTVNNSIQRSQTSNPSKNSNKQTIATATAAAAGGGYPNSYWNQS